MPGRGNAEYRAFGHQDSAVTQEGAVAQLAPHIFDLLHQHGVDHAFGIPGDFALTLFDALAASELEPIVMTHEPGVGFAADAYARIRGLGVAVVTYGVG